MTSRIGAALYQYRQVRFIGGIVVGGLAVIVGLAGLILGPELGWSILLVCVGVAAGAAGIAGLALNVRAAYAPTTRGERGSLATPVWASLGSAAVILLIGSVITWSIHAVEQATVLTILTAAAVVAAFVLSFSRRAGESAKVSAASTGGPRKGTFGRPGLAVGFGVVVLASGAAAAAGLIGEDKFGVASRPFGWFFAAFGIMVIVMAVRQLVGTKN